jgi:hypothetical protein
MRSTLILFLLFVLNQDALTQDTWTDLLDINLSHWGKYLSYRHKPGYNGNIPKDEKGNLIKPIGYNTDETQVFSVIKEDNDLVLAVSGEIYGCVFTKAEYANYHFQVSVKWGNKKYEPRLDKLKDSGILYHSIGEAGAEYWRSWMLSQEFQIMEGHMGDYWSQATSAIDIRAFLPEGKMNSIASAQQPFLSFGAGSPEGFCMRSENRESPANEWTRLDLISFEGKSLHIVNGQVVMILKNSRYVKDGKTLPLTKGKIQLQSEAAEVFFKGIRIREITALPKEFEKYFE